MLRSDSRPSGTIVFGGNGFLGKRLVSSLGMDGASVFAADKDGPSTSYNLADPAQVVRVFEDYFHRYPETVDLRIVVSTGQSVFTETLERTKRELEDVLETNLQIPIFCLNEFIRQAEDRGSSGSAVLLSSVFAQKVPNFENYRFLNRRNSEVYGASKAGLEQITRYYAQRFGRSGLRINAVAPGGVHDPATHSKEFVDSYSKDTALGRMTEAEEVVSAIKFLLSDSSSGITGQVLNVDAGFRL